MIRVDVKADISRALRKLDIGRDEARKAIPRALNKTATTARADAARRIASVGYKIKIAALKRAISIRKANASELRAVLKATGRPIPLIAYGARQTKQGVSIAVLNGRKQLEHAFIATMKSGHKSVFLRFDQATARGFKRDGKLLSSARRGFRVSAGGLTGSSNAKHGLPIRELFGPSVPSAFKNEIVQTALEQAIRERFAVVLEQELRYVVSKR
jgi:hypothetical protein